MDGVKKGKAMAEIICVGNTAIRQRTYEVRREEMADTHSKSPYLYGFLLIVSSLYR